MGRPWKGRCAGPEEERRDQGEDVGLLGGIQARARTVSLWVYAVAPVLLVLVVCTLSLYAAILAVSMLVATHLWRRRGSEKFRLVRKFVVRPHRQMNYRPPLSVHDKGFCPFICINYEYFFEHDIDIQRACEALSNLITELPLLGGRRRGFLMTAHVVCDHRAGVEVEVVETDYTLTDIYHGSPALGRMTTLHPSGFAAGDYRDAFRPLYSSEGAPVLRVRFTKLAGGGSVIALSAAHMTVDAKGLMKVVELWAQESRKLCKRPSENGNKKAAEGEPEVANTQDGTEGEAAEERRKQRKKARGKEEEEHDALARGREEWALLPASTLDRIVAQGADQVPAFSLARFLRETFLYLRGFAIWWFLWFILGLDTQTFFFSDEFLAQLKQEVTLQLCEQRKLKGDKTKPPFVSTNDVLCALMWREMQRVPLREWLMGSCMSRCRTMVDARSLLLPKHLQGTPDEGKFLLGNAVLEVHAMHRRPGAASVMDLACLIRHSIQKLQEEDAALRQIGREYKLRGEPLGFFTGPACMDWYPFTDVVFSSYSPLEGDTDFGRGPAFFYHLEFTPAAFYIHPSRGVDRYAGNKKGFYVSVHSLRSTLQSLEEQLHDFLPAAPPALSKKDEQEADEGDALILDHQDSGEEEKAASGS